jgi:hypothetical protein
MAKHLIATTDTYQRQRTSRSSRALLYPQRIPSLRDTAANCPRPIGVSLFFSLFTFSIFFLLFPFIYLLLTRCLGTPIRLFEKSAQKFTKNMKNAIEILVIPRKFVIYLSIYF